MKKKISQKEIDQQVIGDADVDEAWESWQMVNPPQTVSVKLSKQSVSYLKTLAKIKREKSFQGLLKRWIDERLIYEQRILRSLKP